MTYHCDRGLSGRPFCPEPSVVRRNRFPPISSTDLPPGLEKKEQVQELMERVEASVRGLLGQRVEVARAAEATA